MSGQERTVFKLRCGWILRRAHIGDPWGLLHYCVDGRSYQTDDLATEACAYCATRLSKQGQMIALLQKLDGR